MKPTTDGMLTLYQPLIDWVTMTSWHEEFWSYWRRVSETLKHDTREQSRINYHGIGVKTGEGTLFVGQGVQKGREHYIMQAGGELSDSVMSKVARAYNTYAARVTVIDLQITIPFPEGWKQSDLLSRVLETGRIAGWAESEDRKAGRLQTVYIGSWQSDRLIRVYVKLTEGDEKLLRFEVHYKALRADAAARAIMYDGVTARQILIAEVQRHGSAHLEPFEIALGNGAPHHVRVKQRSSLSKTENWIRTTVIPALNRYSNNKSADMSLIDDVMRSLQRPDRLT
jgi:hypothetical protein